jgi:hypothetical protein
VIGPSGCFKTRTLLKAGDTTRDAPRMLVLDYEDGTDFYDDEFNFARIRIAFEMSLDLCTPEEVKLLQADRYTHQPILAKGKVYGVDFARVVVIHRLATNPLDFVMVDSLTVHYQWLLDKWMDVFYIRETGSKGHKRDYYTMQPRDYDKPARDFSMFAARLRALNVGVFCTAQEKPEYAEGTMMQKIGMTFDAHKRMPYVMDTVVHIAPQEEGKSADAKKRHVKYVAIVKKDRSNLSNERFAWVNQDKEGWSKSFVTMLGQALSFQGRVTEGVMDIEGDDATPPPAEEPKPATTPEPAAATPAPEVRARVDQLRKIKYLKDKLELSDQVWIKAMAKRKVATAKDLTPPEADELIANMYKRCDTQQQMDFDVKFGIREEPSAPPADDSFQDLDQK